MPSARLMSNTSSHWLRVFLPFAAGYYLAYLLRNANAVLAPELTRELGLTAADLGLLTSVYFLAFGAFQVPLGILLDRFGARRVEATLLLFAGAGTFVFALGRDMTELAAGRGLIGMGVSACLMGALKNFSQRYPLERQSSLTGAIMVSGSLGAITASVPLEAMLPLLGWRGVFLLLTAVFLGAAAYLYLAVPDRAEGAAQTRLADQWRGVAHVFASRDFWRFAPLMTLFAGGFMAVAGLWIVPWFIEVDGLMRATAARHLFAIGVAQLAGFFAIAAFATPMIRRGVKPSWLIGGALAITWISQASILTGVRPALPLWLLYSACASAATLGYAALGAHFAPALFGRVSTALNLLVFVGAFSLQWGIGVLVDLFAAASWSPAAAFRAAFAVLAALQLLAWSWFILEGRRAARHGIARETVPPGP